MTAAARPLRTCGRCLTTPATPRCPGPPRCANCRTLGRLPTPGRARRSAPRAVTTPRKALTRALMAVDALTEDDQAALAARPRTRADCKDTPRPCPWAGCKYHLYLDVNPRTGSIKLNHPGLELEDLEHSCALDLADIGGATLDVVGQHMNLTRERARQLEIRGLLTLSTRLTQEAA